MALIMAGCSDPAPTVSYDDLVIRPKLSAEVPRADPETGLITESFPLPLWKAIRKLKQFEEPSEANPLADPFAAPDTSPYDDGLPFQKNLETLGIPFPEGTSASYDAEQRELTVVQTPENMGIIREVMKAEDPREVMISLRFEFYEVPALLALRLEQNACEHSEHTPEWNALRETLKSGDSRLISVALLQGRSGQRTRYQEGDQIVYFAGYERDKESPQSPPRPLYEWRNIGTEIEVEPIAGRREDIIDLNFRLVYHTAPAESVLEAMPAPDFRVPGAGSRPSLPVFHEKSLTTQLGLYSGDIRLLTSWTPTGKAEYAEKDVRHLVFLQAALQSSSP